MDRLKVMLALVSSQLGKLNATHKLLIGSLAVILLMTLLLVALYTGRPRMVELLKGSTAEEQQRAASFLLASGIQSETRSDGKVYIPANQETAARVALAESGKLPSDKTLLFSNLIERQSWINSRAQNEQMYLIALQNQLAADIANFRGIKSATVILDVPEAKGIGRSVRKPTAAVTVMTDDGSPLTQHQVDGIAGYVAGSRSGLDLDRVRVIDAATGRQRKAANEGDLVSSTYLEHAAKVENLAQEKISSLLGYIPGVIVAVTAQVDVTRVNSQTTMHLPEKQGTLVAPKKVTEETSKTVEGQPAAAEPGLRSNVAADINSSGAGGSGSGTETSKNDTEYEVHPGIKTESVIDPKGMPTMVAVSVNVPRSFVVGLLKAGAQTSDAAATTEPTETEIASKFDKDVRPQLESQIRPHVRTMTVAANAGMAPSVLEKLLADSISISMIPVDVQPLGITTKAGVFGGGSLLGFGGGIVDKAVLGLLAVISLGMMFMLVKKSARKVDMPTAEELVGLPPTLSADSDVIGEADESDMPMAGIEVGDEELQRQKVLEQVGEMVGKNPDAAASMINRWMSEGE